MAEIDPGPPPIPGGSYLERKPGRRPMKEYVLSESELNELSGLQTGAAAAFAMSTLLLGFWFTITQAIDFADKVPPLIVAKWRAYGTIAGWLAIALAVLGVAPRVRGHTRLGKIKSETKHEI